jgi:hypothetical protein
MVSPPMRNRKVSLAFSNDLVWSLNERFQFVVPTDIGNLHSKVILISLFEFNVLATDPAIIVTLVPCLCLVQVSISA